MSKRIRGITIEIGGDTTKLGDALKGVDKQAKGIASELREVEKLLKLDPRNVNLLAQRKQLLAEAVKTSTERLGTLKEAQRQAEQAFREGKIGEDQYRAIQREVIAATAELEGLEKQLIEVNNRFKHAGEGIKKFGDRTQELGGKLTPVSAAAGGAIAGIVGLAVKAGQTADDLNTLSKQTGLTTDTLQRFRFAADIIDVSMETMTGSLTKLTRSMGQAQEGNEAVEAAFKSLGVTIVDENGKLRDNETVFHDVIVALSRVEGETERNILSMQLMGKSAQSLNPLILGGADALKKMGDEAAAAGMILSQETLDGLNEFNDVLDTTKAQLAATGAEVGATFGAVLLPMVQDLAKSVQDLATWFRGLDEDTARLILGALAFVAALAPLLIIVGKIITAVGVVVKAIGALKAAAALAKVTVGAFIAVKVLLAAKILAIIAVVGLLVAAVYTLIKRWDDVKAFFAGLWTSVRDTFSSAVSGLLRVVQSLWDGAVGRFQSMIGRIREIVAGVTDAIAAPFRRAREIVGDITTTIGNFLQRLNPFARSSPSLVENVTAGVRAIQREYGKLEQLRLPTLSATMTPAFAGAASPAASVQAAPTHQGPLVVVERMTVREEADIDKISRALYKHIQAASRAQGGR